LTITPAAKTCSAGRSLFLQRVLVLPHLVQHPLAVVHLAAVVVTAPLLVVLHALLGIHLLLAHLFVEAAVLFLRLLGGGLGERGLARAQRDGGGRDNR
jgi:hypothetical protein